LYYIWWNTWDTIRGLLILWNNINFRAFSFEWIFKTWPIFLKKLEFFLIKKYMIFWNNKFRGNFHHFLK
jgi:hypothetical protein